LTGLVIVMSRDEKRVRPIYVISEIKPYFVPVFAPWREYHEPAGLRWNWSISLGLTGLEPPCDFMQGGLRLRAWAYVEHTILLNGG
jgi:hypothetical protein